VPTNNQTARERGGGAEADRLQQSGMVNYGSQQGFHWGDNRGSEGVLRVAAPFLPHGLAGQGRLCTFL
jgi:hypothetical protein